MRRAALALALLAFVQPVLAETVTVSPSTVTEWKAVYGRIEARDRVPARARIGGTVVDLTVSEGDTVSEGQAIARLVDDKIAFQLDALVSQNSVLAAQLANAETELKRGEQLLSQGVSTVQRLDSLRTQVDVLRGQIAALAAQTAVVRQSEKEGSILAPATGRVLDVPIARGSVLMPGETVAVISAGGTYLRLAVPERHAAMLVEGARIAIEGAAGATEGRLAKVYPLVENGRVIADVEIEDTSDRFIDARVLVRLPMGTREALMVPASALLSQGGLDFVQVETPTGPVARAVVPARPAKAGPSDTVEILSGLVAGDRVITDPVAGASHD